MCSRRSSCFAVTLGHVDWTKKVIGEWLQVDGYANRICVGAEPYHPPLDCETGEAAVGDVGYHHHIFIETREKWLLCEIRDHFMVFTGGEEFSINIQTCKSPKSWLIYISKEDNCPFMYNIRVSELSLFARAWHHARTRYRYPQPVNRVDDFIVSCGQNARFAIGICEEHVNYLRKKRADDRALYIPNNICELTNDLLVALENSSHMYIYGEPGLGKTELVDWFLRGKNYWKAGEPSNFLFGTLPDSVDYIWFEDFMMEKYKPYLATLLSMMDHKEVTVSRKGIDDCTKIIQAKFIFCSNYKIEEFLYPMFLRRLCLFDVEHRLFTCQGCGRYEGAYDGQSVGDGDEGHEGAMSNINSVGADDISNSEGVIGNFSLDSQALFMDLQEHLQYENGNTQFLDSFL